MVRHNLRVAEDHREEGTVPAPAPFEGPTIVRRRLGARMRAAREATGKSVMEVVADRSLGISKAKLHRIEAGNHLIKPQDVHVLGVKYGLNGEVIEALARLAVATDSPSWFHSYAEEGAVPEWFSLYLGVEPLVGRFRTYQGELVPGLLQSPEYAEAVYRARNPDAATTEIDKRVALRMERQGILARATPAPPTLHVILNEAVLRRTVGGSATMRDQIDRLRTAAQRDTITIDVLPMSAGAHAAMETSFSILDFPDRTQDPSVVYIETPTSASYLQRLPELARYEAIFEHIQSPTVPILEWMS